MATATKAEKAVRTVPGERPSEIGDAGAAALEALERIARLLEEEVIPRLPEETPPSDDEPDGEAPDEEAPAPRLGRGRVLPCRKGGPTPADKAVAAKIGPKLRGKLRGHLTAERVCCARQIVAAVKRRRLHKRAAVIAVTTTIVESTIRNVAYGDRDSLGLFQQRASWGTRAQRLNPTWTTNAFLNAMLRKFPGNSWLTTPIGKVCQRVQVSAFPGRYQPEAADAAIIVGALWGARALEAPAAAEEPYPEDDLHGLGLEEAEPPEVPEDGADEPPAQDVPAAVTEAFEELYGTLSAEQAEALAGLFAAMADALEGGEDDGVEIPDDEEPPEDGPMPSHPGAGKPSRAHGYA